MMNERILELAEQAGASVSTIGGIFIDKTNLDIEKFAELIVGECKENFGKVWYEQGLDIRGAELGKFMTRFEQHFGVK
jgi:hypothetical protein